VLSVIDRKQVEFRRAKKNCRMMRAAFIVALSLVVGVLVVGVLAPSAASAETATRAEAAGPFAYVTVAGAPGDGEEALAAALSRQLAARGLTPATAFQANVYEVQGTVRVAPGAKGKESITIIWVVLAPDGTQLGVTRQTKDVRKGALDKKWGPAANAAAAAAAEDIAKLIPK
jgi:hypothetical protein